MVAALIPSRRADVHADAVQAYLNVEDVEVHCVNTAAQAPGQCGRVVRRSGLDVGEPALLERPGGHGRDAAARCTGRGVRVAAVGQRSTRVARVDPAGCRAAPPAPGSANPARTNASV